MAMPYDDPSYGQNGMQMGNPVDWYRVAFIGGISVRAAPDANAPCTGLTLPCEEVFAVSESFLGVDQRIYLRLQDGSGWVFDDIHLVPEDPSVARLPQASMLPAGMLPDASERQGATGPVLTTVPMSAMGSTAPAPAPQPVGPLATTPGPTPILAMFGDRNGMPVQATPVEPPSRWYQVEAANGICVRVAPDSEAPMTREVLAPGTWFEVSDGLMVNGDQRLHLRLVDGRGWVYDDSMCSTHERTVVPITAPYPDATRAGKKEGKEHKNHVPYWVRLRRAKLQGSAKPGGRRQA